jgi:hypothetical protein
MTLQQDKLHHDSLWALVVGPTIWSAYFLAVYVVAAVYCAKAGGPFADLAAVRLFVAGSGLVALLAIGAWGLRAGRRWRRAGGALPPHGDDTDQSRHQFLALATLLLCGVSFVATIYVALPAVFIEVCR